MIATAFANSTRIAAGPLAEVALAVRRFQRAVPDTAVLIFDDATGRVIDLDLRGTEAEIVARLPTSAESKCAGFSQCCPFAAWRCRVLAPASRPSGFRESS